MRSCPPRAVKAGRVERDLESPNSMLISAHKAHVSEHERVTLPVSLMSRRAWASEICRAESSVSYLREGLSFSYLLFLLYDLPLSLSLSLPFFPPSLPCYPVLLYSLLVGCSRKSMHGLWSPPLFTPPFHPSNSSHSSVSSVSPASSRQLSLTSPCPEQSEVPPN